MYILRYILSYSDTIGTVCFKSLVQLTKFHLLEGFSQLSENQLLEVFSQFLRNSFSWADFENKLYFIVGPSCNMLINNFFSSSAFFPTEISLQLLIIQKVSSSAFSLAFSLTNKDNLDKRVVQHVFGDFCSIQKSNQFPKRVLQAFSNAVISCRRFESSRTAPKSKSCSCCSTKASPKSGKKRSGFQYCKNFGL